MFPKLALLLEVLQPRPYSRTINETSNVSYKGSFHRGFTGRQSKVTVIGTTYYVQGIAVSRHVIYPRLGRRNKPSKFSLAENNWDETTFCILQGRRYS